MTQNIVGVRVNRISTKAEWERRQARAARRPKRKSPALWPGDGERKMSAGKFKDLFGNQGLDQDCLEQRCKTMSDCIINGCEKTRSERAASTTTAQQRIGGLIKSLAAEIEPRYREINARHDAGEIDFKTLVRESEKVRADALKKHNDGVATEVIKLAVIDPLAKWIGDEYPHGFAKGGEFKPRLESCPVHDRQLVAGRCIECTTEAVDRMATAPGAITIRVENRR